MKKLRKLTLKQLSECSQIIEKEEQMQFMGGDGIDGLCYFNCLSYLSNQYGCDGSFGNYYISYAQTYGASEAWNGPSSYGDILDFTNSNFTTTGATFSPYIMAQTVEYNSMLAIIPTSDPSVHHAVVLNSYHDGVFSYFDPTTGKNGTISAGSVIFGIGITGCPK